MNPSTPVTTGDAGSSVSLHDNDNVETRIGTGADCKPRSKTARQREDDMAREASDLIDRTLADLEEQMAELKHHQARRGQEITNLSLSFEEMGKDLGRLEAQFATLQCQIGELRCDSELLNRAVLELRGQGQDGLTEGCGEEEAHGGDGRTMSTILSGGIVWGSQGQAARSKRPRSGDDDDEGTGKRRRHEE
jgi:hypothetical protein